jgi:hypothetical protein
VGCCVYGRSRVRHALRNISYHGQHPFLHVHSASQRLTQIQLGLAYMFGARFDVALDQLKQGKFRPPPADEAPASAFKSSTGGHSEL